MWLTVSVKGIYSLTLITKNTMTGKTWCACIKGGDDGKLQQKELIKHFAFLEQLISLTELQFLSGACTT